MPRAPKAPGHSDREHRPAWRNSTRRSELPANWPLLCRIVKKNAGGRCQLVVAGERCPSAGTDTDHIVPGGAHVLSNLQLLCARHHAQKSSAEGGTSARQARG